MYRTQTVAVLINSPKRYIDIGLIRLSYFPIDEWSNLERQNMGGGGERGKVKKKQRRTSVDERKKNTVSLYRVYIVFVDWSRCYIKQSGYLRVFHLL